MVELTFGRFQNLADTYGGVIARWPEAYRTEAMAMARQPYAAAILAEALALDTALDGWAVPMPSMALSAHIVAMAPRERAGATRRVRLWWSGIGVAAALAGATAGAATVAVVVPGEHVAGTTTTFGDVTGQEG